MATIKARWHANGTTRYTAIVRRRVGKAIVHPEAKTFTHHSAAVSWAQHREVGLEDPATLARRQHAPIGGTFGNGDGAVPRDTLAGTCRTSSVPLCSMGRTHFRLPIA